jgi:hypothetical protein
MDGNPCNNQYPVKIKRIKRLMPIIPNVHLDITFSFASGINKLTKNPKIGMHNKI